MVLENGRFSKACQKAVLEDGEVKLHPKRFDNTYAHWLNNIRDWNISRQLVGSTNPAYFYGDGKEDFVVAESIEAALELAKVKLLTSHFSLLTLDKMLMH
jgi:valyl-tRNA synthetase